MFRFENFWPKFGYGIESLGEGEFQVISAIFTILTY